MPADAYKKTRNVTEVLGVVWGVKHFRPYLYGHQCDVYTGTEVLVEYLPAVRKAQQCSV